MSVASAVIKFCSPGLNHFTQVGDCYRFYVSFKISLFNVSRQKSLPNEKKITLGLVHKE